MNPERLADAPLPAIAKGRNGDFFLLGGERDGRVLVHPTDGPPQSLTPQELRDIWGGETVYVTTRAEIGGQRAFDVTWFIPALVKYRGLLGEVLLASLVLQIFALATPLIFQVVIDKALVHKGLVTLDVLAIGLISVIAFDTALGGLRAYLFAHTTSRVDVELGAPGPAGNEAAALPQPTEYSSANAKGIACSASAAISPGVGVTGMISIRSVFTRWLSLQKGEDKSTDFKALADNSLDLIVRCGHDQIATYASPASVAILGVTPEELVGRSHLDFVHAADRSLLDAVIARHLAGEPNARATFRIIRADGTVVWVEGSGRMVVDHKAGTTDFVVIMRDVTASKLAEEKLAAMALTDGLTGLGNRRAFDEVLEREWRRTQRTGNVLSLLLLDVDFFKKFNDQYGHQTGDDCLRAVASVVASAAARPDDVAARYGGEELAVILSNTGAKDAQQTAEKIRAGVEALNIPHAGNVAGSVTVSIGVATAMSQVGASMQMPAGLLQAADSALYKAKHKGRNRVDVGLILTANETQADAA